MVLVLEISVIFFSFYSHIGSYTTHYDGEIEAIYYTLHQLSARLSTSHKAVILSDSSSAIQALTCNQYKRNSRMQYCRGNEMENLLAERGTDIIQISARDLPLLLENLKINRIYKKCFRNIAISDATNKSWRVLLKPNCVSDSPRATAVAELRLLTEYGSL
ncbi:hypothetical protein TNCV_4687051 [Trichonephila clavipes]|nr:hypothetical protein TNCV_4687051 [Trichonephila clavipes]